MIPVTLPSAERRSVLQSFWLWISLGSGGMIALAAWWLRAPFPLLMGLIGAAGLALIVFLQERFVRRLHGAWNRRLVRPVAGFAARCVLGICFFVIFVATGRLGSKLALRGPVGWAGRASLDPTQYRSPFVGPAGNDGSWVSTYVRWAFATGNGWSICLLPFLWFVRFVSQDEEQAAAANIYTLF